MNGTGIPNLKGLDLKVGGEWARNLYDEKIPNFLNKYAKKWGAKVETSELHNNEHVLLKPMTAGQYWEQVQKPVGMRKPTNPDAWIVVMDMGEGEKVSQTGPDKFASQAEADAYAKDANQKSGAFTKVHSIEITPAMKKSVIKEGQPIAKNTVPSTSPHGSLVLRTPLPKQRKQLEAAVLDITPPEAAKTKYAKLR